MADGVKKSGDWKGAKQTARYLKRYTQIAERRTLDIFLQRMQQNVVHHLINDDLGWIGLSRYTIDKKGHDRKLRNTDKYLNNIRSWKKGKFAYIGVKDGVREKNGTSLGEVARRQEEGYTFTSPTGRTVVIPERPLWKPTAEEVFLEMQQGFNSAAEILDRLLRHGH